jgi:hypothetical protein
MKKITIFTGDDAGIINNCKSMDNKKVYLFHIGRKKYELIKFLKNNKNIKNTIFGIEEIELGLFSKQQKEIVNIIAKLYNKGNIFYITTNSPYILCSLNNLIMANMILNKYPNNEKIYKKYKDVAVNIDDVAAFKMQKGKEPINILDVESDLIDDSQIDDISDGLSKEFYKFLELMEEN